MRYIKELMGRVCDASDQTIACSGLAGMEAFLVKAQQK